MSLRPNRRVKVDWLKQKREDHEADFDDMIDEIQEEMESGLYDGDPSEDFEPAKGETKL